MLIRASASAAVLGLTFVVGACASSDPIASCIDKVNQGYPEMRTIALETMPSSAVLGPIDGSDNCEETAIARAGVSVEVDEWRTKQQAVSYLLSHGWHRNPSWYLTSTEHEFVSAVVERSTTHGRKPVKVYLVAFSGLDG